MIIINIITFIVITIIVIIIIFIITVITDTIALLLLILPLLFVLATANCESGKGFGEQFLDQREKTSERATPTRRVRSTIDP